jgi:hypothetical protein
LQGPHQVAKQKIYVENLEKKEFQEGFTVEVNDNKAIFQSFIELRNRSHSLHHFPPDNSEK